MAKKNRKTPAKKNKIAPKIAFIGGSGLYEVDGFRVIDKIEVKTPWGLPSAKISIAELDGIQVAFLPRHGKGHRLLPSEIPYKANIAALKHLGVLDIVAFSACGSLKEKIKPLDFVLPRQVIDRTRQRENSFFGNGIAGHIAFADPFDNTLEQVLYREMKKMRSLKIHRNETLVVMEGPAFSTRAESNLYRSWKAGVINMTALPEAKLAREAEMGYQVVAMVTDYDCWKAGEEEVNVQMLINRLQKNAENAKKVIKAVTRHLGTARKGCIARSASSIAIITEQKARPKKAVKALKFILPNYF